MKIREQIETVGHAQVLVVLKPVTRRVKGRVQLAATETQEVQLSAAQKLMPYFKEFPNSRAALLSSEVSQPAAKPILRKRKELPSEAVQPVRKSRGFSALSAGTDAISIAGDALSVRYFPRLGVLLGTVDKAGLDRLLAAHDEVSALSTPPEFSLIHPLDDANDAALAGAPPGDSWGVTRLQIPHLWDQGLTGAGVLVGHLDTGVDATHGALIDAVDVFAEFDYLGEQIAGAQPKDTGFHGTHTAGIIAGRDFHGHRFGVAPGAKLACAIVIEKGDVPGRVIGGLEWCVDQGCRIINLSLGVRGYNPSFNAIMTILRQRGVLTVAAVGNEGPHTSRSPGNYRQVVSVGACDPSDAIWWSSSSQILPGTPQRTVPDLVAPGQQVWSSYPNGLLRPLSGTSMAAPHISGLAALLLEDQPGASVEKVEKAIFDSCQRPAGVSSNRANRGVPDAKAALAALRLPP